MYITSNRMDYHINCECYKIAYGVNRAGLDLSTYMAIYD